MCWFRGQWIYRGRQYLDSTIKKLSSVVYKYITGNTNSKLVFSDTSFFLHKMYFPSVNVGYLVGRAGQIRKTADGGLTWEKLTSTVSYNLNDIYFINDSVGSVAADSGTVLYTTDAGYTWKKQSTGSKGGINKLFFVNDSIGFAFSGTSIYKINRNVNGIWENLYPEKRTFTLYPNPATGKFYVRSDFKIKSVKVTNLFGSEIYFDTVTMQTPELDLSTYAKGLYTVTLTFENDSFAAQRLLITE
jgi:hypothetical protein